MMFFLLFIWLIALYVVLLHCQTTKDNTKTGDVALVAVYT